MAKIKNFTFYLPLLLCCWTGCVLKAELSDTAASDQVTPSKVTPIDEVVGVLDTVQYSEDRVQAVGKNRPDTIKTTVVLAPVVITADMKRLAVQRIYTSQIGVREATGRNDGPQIKIYLRSVGLPEGHPYCAAGVHWCLEMGGVKNTITAWSPTSLNMKALVWWKYKKVQDPKIADVISLWYNGLGRIAHTGFWDRDVNGSFYESVEFNTNSESSREGNGVFRRKRSYKATYAISRHIN